MPARRFALIVRLAVTLVLAAPPVRLPAQTPANDERTVRLVERYKTMLMANPVEGLALDRLWKSAEDAGTTGVLLDEYRRLTAKPAAGSNGAAAALVYGHLLEKAGRSGEAEAAYRRAGEIDPAGLLPLLAQAKFTREHGKPADAAALLERALGKLPTGDARRADLLLQTGNAWLAAGRETKAAESWESMVALDPGNLALRRELAANYEKNNLPDRAISHDEYIDKHGNPAERAGALRELARIHQGRGNFDAARDACERGLSLTARDNWLHGELENQLILLYQRAGRTGELDARWQAAVTENPRDLGGFLRLEHLAAAQGDPAGQRGALRKIISLNPRDRDNTLKLARLSVDAGERAAAAALYDGLIKLQPENIELILARADLDLQMDQSAAAITRVEARVARTPADESVTSPALEFFLSHHLDEAAERRLRAEAARQPAADEPPLALAKFLYARHHPAESHAVLEGLIARPGDPAARAARLMQAADCYKEQNNPEDALRCWRLASELRPDLPAPLIAASETLLACGEFPEACSLLERAAQATPAGTERVEVERRLFQALQQTDLDATSPALLRKGGAPPAAPRPARSVTTPLGPGRLLPDGTALARYLDRIHLSSRDHPTAENYLRLARWSQWTHDLPAAITSAETAASIDPQDLASREMLAGLAIEGRQHEVAERWLREIMAIDPKRRAACLKQIAGCKLDDGDFDEAINLLEDLQRAVSPSVATLSDLALAQQRADRWYDARTTWERAYTLPGATPAQRAEVRRPLLAVLERLEEFPRAAEILQAAVDAATGLDARQDLFRELATFCRQHHLLDRLRRDYEGRLKARPQDYFLLTALSEMRREAGREREAYRLLDQAFYSAPEPVRSLRGLVDAAESLGAIDEAVGFQRKLTALPGQGTVENFEKLASLENAGSRAEAATRTWELVAARFPRDPLALAHAGAFFEGAGNTVRARDLLNQIVRINAADSRQLYHLGELDATSGDPVAARAAYDQLLAHTEPEKTGAPLILPAGLDQLPPLEAGSSEMTVYRRAFRSSGGAAAVSAASSEDGDARLRLKAIREISLLLFPARGKAAAAPAVPAVETARQQWLAHWREAEQNGARSEPLWAYFYANQKGLVMDCLTRWLGKEPADGLLHKAFLGLGVRMGDYQRVAGWVWSPDETLGGPGTRGREMIQTLGQWLVGPDIPVEPGLVAGLFPPGVNARDILWLAATNVFAARGRYEAAVELGERLFEGSSLEYRARYGVELAGWQLFLGREERARSVLRGVLAQSESNSLDTSEGGAVFAALRIYYLLLPADERHPFVDAFLAEAGRKFSAPYAALAGVLLHGLAGDEAAARRNLDAVLAMRLLANEEGSSSSDARRWNFLLTNGVQLQTWNLAPLAVYLWRHALAESTAFDREQADSKNMLADLRGQLLLAEVSLASGPQAARELVDNYLRLRPVPGGATAIAAQLVSAGRHAEAARVDEYLCEIEPEAADHWQERYTALRSSGDLNGAERLWRGLLSSEHWPAGLSRQETVRQLAALLENEMSDGETARQVLWRERAADQGSSPAILNQLAASYERAGQWENAVRTFLAVAEGDPSGAAILAAANLVAQKLGDPARALELVRPLTERNLSPVEHDRFEAAKIGLLLAAGQTEEAVEGSFDLLHENRPEIVSGVAGALTAHGQGAVARQLMTASVRRLHDPPGRLRQQKALVEMLAGTPGDDVAFRRELGRLRILAEQAGPLREVYDDVRYETTRKRGLTVWLESELTRDWQDGKGRQGAGEDLVRLYVETQQATGLTRVVGQLLARPLTRETEMPKLLASLLENGYTALAVSVGAELNRLTPENDATGLAYAKALWKDGRQPEAGRVLAALSAMAGIRENIDAEIGQACLEIGDRSQARLYLERAVALDPLALRNPQAHLKLAELDMDAGKWPEARRHLRAGWRVPARDEFSGLARYLCATVSPGPNAVARLGGRVFPLSFAQRARLLLPLTAALDKAGRRQDADDLLAANPSWLAAVPEFLPALRDRLAPDNPEAAVKLFSLVEQTVMQADSPCLCLNRQLATLYTTCAEREPDAKEIAAARLVRACALAPDYFPAAKRLARLQIEQGKNAAATETLRSFLAADALPEQRAEAVALLQRG